MRIGYFGGTFDPPHRGHLAAAQAARDRFALDRVLLAPTGRQPLKQSGPCASFEDRLAMMRALCGEEPALEASAIDSPRADGNFNYTLDVLRRLGDKCDHVFCIVGADSFLDLRRWREPDELLRLAEWIVVSRPGFSLDNLQPLELSDAQLERVHLLTDVCVDVSATRIRAQLAEGVDCVDGLTDSVRRYIREHHLYLKEKNCG